MRILITDGDARAALAVTRSLGRLHEVWVGERYAPCLSQVSRFCTHSLTYPDPATDRAGFVETLLRTIRDQHIDVLIPITDTSTFVVVEHREALESLCTIPIPPAEALDRAADKVHVLQAAIRLGVPVPRTWFVASEEEFGDGARDLTFPVAVKAHRSRIRTATGWHSTRVGYASTLADLRCQLRHRQPGEFPMIIQERIHGPGLGVFACYKDNELVALFGHRRVREKPPSGGVSVLSESVAVDAVTQRRAESLLRDLRWEGVAMVEFKVDSTDGIPKLMEINGRFWGSLQLAVTAGVDFPAILLSDAKGHDGHLPSYRLGIRNRWLLGDLDSLLTTLFSGETGIRSKLRSLGWFLQFWDPNLHYESPSATDFRPFVYEARQWFRRLFASRPS